MSCIFECCCFYCGFSPCNFTQNKVTYLLNNDEKFNNFNLEGKTIDVYVKSVYDGDTIHVVVPIELNVFSFDKKTPIVTVNKNIDNDKNPNIKFYDITVRLLGIDTPEMKPRLNIPNRNEHIIKAKKAKDYLSDLINNKIITVVFSKNEKFGRHLGTIFYNNEDINKKMIDLNYAVPYFGGTKT